MSLGRCLPGSHLGLSDSHRGADSRVSLPAVVLAWSAPSRWIPSEVEFHLACFSVLVSPRALSLTLSQTNKALEKAFEE